MNIEREFVERRSEQRRQMIQAGIQKGKRIMTNLNADMIIIRGPMGRDRAAFSLSSDAWEFMRSIGHLTNCHWIKPSGETAQWADFADYDEFLNWTYSEFVK